MKKEPQMDTRTNIVLDDDLIAQAMARAGVTTKKAAVEAALKAFVRKPDYSGLLALRGADMLADDYDPDEAYKSHPVEPLFAMQERAKYGGVPGTPAKAKVPVAKTKAPKR
jgi:Arc/MetJ family transcription regulator